MIADKKFGHGGPYCQEIKLKILFEDQLRDLYWSEKELTRAVPDMISKVTSPDLAHILRNHLAETQRHIRRIEQIFMILGEEADATNCKTMYSILCEARDLMDDSEAGTMRDAAIVLAGQKIEHYEIAAYDGLHTLAQMLGMYNVARLLEETLTEEKTAEEHLKDFADALIHEWSTTIEA